MVDNLEKPHNWLLNGDLFTPDVIETGIEYKPKNEVDAVRLRGVLRHLSGRAGAGAPVVTWATYASMTGSPFLPTDNHVNLALTYFSEGSRITGDSRRVVEQQFSSTWEVSQSMSSLACPSVGSAHISRTSSSGIGSRTGWNWPRKGSVEVAGG